jgi:hypothetical protein
MFGADHAMGAKRLSLPLASPVSAQWKAGWRDALRSEPVMWRS